MVLIVLSILSKTQFFLSNVKNGLGNRLPHDLVLSNKNTT